MLAAEVIYQTQLYHTQPCAMELYDMHVSPPKYCGTQAFARLVERCIAAIAKSWAAVRNAAFSCFVRRPVSCHESTF
jgi:hypothetical protein